MNRATLPYVWVMTAEYAPTIIGGLGTVATELTNALISSQVRINIITTCQSNTIQLSKGKNRTALRIPATVRYFNHAADSYKPAAVQRLTSRCFPRKPDAIHIHSLEFAQAALFFKRTYRIPVIYTCHSLVSMEGGGGNHRSRLQNALIRYANRIVVPSFWLKRQLQRQYAGISLEIKVIPNGVRSYSSGTRAPRYKLLYVGRLISDKGIEALVRSISQLKQSDKRVTLTVIGTGPLDYRRRLKAIASRQGTSANIRWLGPMPQSKVQHMYSSFGAVVVPSKQESFCLVALEAMANGVPLVSTRVGGLTEFVSRRNAQIIPSVNSNAISRAIKTMWNDPRGTRQRVMHAKLVAKHSQWHTMAARYKALFRGVM